MASSHDATCPCNLLQGLVAGTSPLVCADLKIRNMTAPCRLPLESQTLQPRSQGFSLGSGKSPGKLNFLEYINNSLHLARKYDQIFDVRGHNLFREANCATSFPGSLSFPSRGAVSRSTGWEEERPWERGCEL